VRQLKFSPDGNELLSVSSMSDANVWDLNFSSLADRSRARANRNLTRAEWRDYMGGEPYRKTCPDLPDADNFIARATK
jgi:hypothetical protein